MIPPPTITTRACDCIFAPAAAGCPERVDAALGSLPWRHVTTDAGRCPWMGMAIVLGLTVIARDVAIMCDVPPCFGVVARQGKKKTLTQMKEGDAHRCTQMSPCGLPGRGSRV